VGHGNEALGKCAHLVNAEVIVMQAESIKIALYAFDNTEKTTKQISLLYKFAFPNYNIHLNAH
jgi:diphthamide synthase (EF-2-diphthine--ammonia ligase)